MNKSTNRRRTSAYKSVHRAISALLYETDPWGMGSTIGAPDDEYDEATTRLIPALLRSEAGNVGEPALEELPEGLVGRLRELVTPLRASDIPEH